MRNRILAVAAIVTFVVATGVSQASASTIVYSTRAAFDAGTTGTSTVDFNGIAAPGGFVGYGGGPAVFSGITVTGDGAMFVIDPAYYGFSYAGGGFLNSDFAGATNTLHFVLPSMVTAIGFDFGGLFGGPVTFQIMLGNGDAFSASSAGSTASGTLGFVGFGSTVGFTYFDVVMPDSPFYNAIDNLTTGQAVPEPASMTLIATGLAGLVARRLRRRTDA